MRGIIGLIIKFTIKLRQTSSVLQEQSSSAFPPPLLRQLKTQQRSRAGYKNDKYSSRTLQEQPERFFQFVSILTLLKSKLVRGGSATEQESHSHVPAKEPVKFDIDEFDCATRCFAKRCGVRVSWDLLAGTRRRTTASMTIG
jgi:hypothetical protein